jgi:adenine-specific DNA-methyltransferase
MAQLDFKGKTFVRNHHLLVKYHELLPDQSKSLTDKVSLHDNLIIHGDNLKALKALLPLYAGKIKCIYIDPPYNTGNEKWVYSDNVNSPMLQEWLGKVVDRDDLTRHDKWLCMMMPRLKLLRELLSEDGVILISIDDNEAYRLRALMDETFTEDNFIAQLVWEKGRKNDAKFFSVGHEYMLVYAKSLARLKELKTIWREPKPGAIELWEKYCELKKIYDEDYDKVENDLQEWFKDLPAKHPSKKLARYRHVDQWGPWRDRDISWPGGGGPGYDVIHPVTKLPCKVPERGWGFANHEAMQRQINLGLVVFREDHIDPPYRKAHLRPVPEELDENEVFDDDEADTEVEVGMQVMPSVLYKQSQVTIKYFRQLMGDIKFENPKDHEVLARVIRYVTGGDKDATVLDSFAGSGTTAHAVLAINAQDHGNRRFILIECEDYANSKTAERVRRVIKGVKKAKDEAIKNGIGGSFSYFELGDSIEIESLLDGTKLPSYTELARYIFYTATGEEFDEEVVDEQTHFIGESKQYQVYLYYEPDIDVLKGLAFTLNKALALPALKPEKRHLVFAPTKYLDQDHLDQFRVDFAQLPFEIYERTR